MVDDAAQDVRVLHALPRSSLVIRGATTVGARWHCQARNIESRAAVSAASLRDTSGVPDVRGVTIRVPVSNLRCQSGPMERAMRRALRADRDTAAQVIVGRFEIYEEQTSPHPGETFLAGGLRVAGIERNIFVRSTIEPQADGTLHVRHVLPLTLSAFDIEAPRVLWGAVRARDGITVEVDLYYPGRSTP